MATKRALGLVVLWAGTVGAEPYACLGRDGRLRLLAASPPACSVTETLLAWDRVGRAPARQRADVARPVVEGK